MGEPCDSCGRPVEGDGWAECNACFYGGRRMKPPCAWFDPKGPVEYPIGIMLEDGRKHFTTVDAAVSLVEALQVAIGAALVSRPTDGHVDHPSHVMEPGSSFASGHEYDSDPYCTNCLTADEDLLALPCPGAEELRPTVEGRL